MRSSRTNLWALPAMLFGASLAFAQRPAHATDQPWLIVAEPAPPGDVVASVEGTYLETGARQRRGGAFPGDVRLTADKPAALRVDATLKNPRFGTFRVGPSDTPRLIALVLDEPQSDKPGENPDAVLFLDSNADNTITPDEATTLPAQTYDLRGTQMVNRSATISIGIDYPDGQRRLAYTFTRWDPRDGRRMARDSSGEIKPRDVIDFVGEYGWAYRLTFDGKEFDALLFDEMGGGDFRGPRGGNDSGVRLLIDLNANGSFDRRGEDFDPWKPFTLFGQTYRVRGLPASGARFQIARTTERAPEIPVPPDLSRGKASLPFTGRGLDRELVRFPTDFRGRLVLLHFWHTKSKGDAGTPELIAKLVTASDQLRAVTVVIDEPTSPANDKGEARPAADNPLDQQQRLEELRRSLREAAKGRNWPHILDAANALAISNLYQPGPNPRVYLIDADTGEILAAGRETAGDALERTVMDSIKARGMKTK